MRAIPALVVLALAASACAPPVAKSGHDAAVPDGTDASSAFDGGPSDVDGGSPDAGEADAGPDFTPVSVSAAVAKVKNLLVGLPPTDAEVEAVVADRAALNGLVAQWMTLPQYNEKLLRFFTTQFQQDQWTFWDLTFQFHGNIPFMNDQRRFVENLQQSFARTALQLIAEGKPFTEVLTTKRLMMTTAVMATYATVDVTHMDDGYNMVDLFQRDQPSQVTVQSAGNIPLQQTTDPLNPYFLVFNAPSIATSYQTGCPYGTLTYPAPASYSAIADLLYGYQPRVPDRPGCFPPLVAAPARYITDADFSDWRMVTVRQPQTAEATTRFYDLLTMRGGQELVLHTPRVGFFTTPAFAARWQTNDSNQHRVVANQTLIVALGKPIGLTNTTQPRSLAALDTAHAGPGTTCYECHQSLDPMRQFFHQSYSYYFGTQDVPEVLAVDGQFAFHGVVGSGSRIEDLGDLLASHPMFGAAWVQKLCTYASSAPCDESDPEFQRLVGVFTESHYNWNALAKALFASPLVTYLQATDSVVGNGQVFPVARRDHLCATLSSRLGIADVCGLNVNTPSFSQVLTTIAGSWPSDQYSRGNESPSLAVTPSTMTRGGMEALCFDLAQKLVDNGTSGYNSADPTASIDKLTGTLMGLTSDRSAGPAAVLLDHYNAALAMGTPPTNPQNKVNAMKSTFVLACLSPYVIGVGQ